MITFDRECARLDCDTRFVPKRADARYCEAHRGKNAARDVSRARSHERTCLICEQPFTATDSRQYRCEDCAVITVKDDAGKSRSVRVPASGIIPTPVTRPSRQRVPQNINRLPVSKPVPDTQLPDVPRARRMMADYGTPDEIAEFIADYGYLCDLSRFVSVYGSGREARK